MPPTDRAFTSAGRDAVEATLARAGLSRVGGGTRNTYFAHVSHADRAGYAVRVGPKAYRVVWRVRSHDTTIGPERYHGQTDHAALEAWARACTTRAQDVCPPVLPEGKRTRPPAAARPPAPAAAPAAVAPVGSPGHQRTADDDKAADAFRADAPKLDDARVPSSDLDTIRIALDAAGLVLPAGTEAGLVKGAIEAAGAVAVALDKLDSTIDDAEAWIEDAGDRYAQDTADARAVAGVVDALAAVLPLGVWADALAAGRRGDSVGVLRALGFPTY